MSKEMRKMYFWAILKVIFALGLTAIVVWIMSGTYKEIEPVATVVCSVLWGIVVVVYLYGGIRTMVTGQKQIKEYMEASGYNRMQLDEEYGRANAYGRLHIGEKHAFVNAADRFYVIPLTTISDIYVRNHGANRAKGRQGYYYLYIEATGLEHRIKAYYMTKRPASEAEEALKFSVNLRKELEMPVQ